MPADAAPSAAFTSARLGDKIAKVLENKALTIDDTTSAHLEETRHRIAKVLDATLDDNQP